jgi:hypothetical protein
MAKWLDKYENGGEYLGTTNVGRNYSPAWGGQFQMGGYVYPTTFVPQAQKGEKVRFIEPPPIDYELQHSGDPSKKYPVSSDVMKQIVATSVGMGYDPKRALAVALQESGIGRTDPNYFHVLRGKTKSGKDRIPEEYQNLTMDELGIQLLKDKQKLANKLGYTTPEMELQTYNGLGKIFRDTEKDYHGFEMQKIYGVPIPKEGIDLRKNPLYGKRIMDLEKEVINKDPYVNQLVDYYNKFYSNPDSVYYTKASNLEPIEIVAPSKAKKQKTENSVVKEGFLKLVDDLKNGGSVPGSVGFTYARTQGIPSEGPYAKKTMPSAQNGQEMSFYQHGLDWTPRNISKNGSVVKDNNGYWNPENWGKPVEIDSNEITMQGVYEPLLGVSDTGDVQMMYPGEDYTFDGESVTEYPVAKYGINQQDEKTVQHLDQLTNFTNKPKAKSGGWLDKY